MDEAELSREQAYETAWRFVWQYRERERQPDADSLDLLLVHMRPVADYARTGDPAAWEDWQECVAATLRGDPLPTWGE